MLKEVVQQGIKQSMSFKRELWSHTTMSLETHVMET
jgi:hypothetical protein